MLSNYSNDFRLLTSVTQGFILDAAGVLDPPMPKGIRVEQNTYGKYSFLMVT